MRKKRKESAEVLLNREGELRCVKVTKRRAAFINNSTVLAEGVEVGAVLTQRCESSALESRLEGLLGLCVCVCYFGCFGGVGGG